MGSEMCIRDRVCREWGIDIDRADGWQNISYNKPIFVEDVEVSDIVQSGVLCSICPTLIPNVVNQQIKIVERDVTGEG